MRSAADSIYSPNRFELLNCENMGNDKSSHPYHKDTTTVDSDTVNNHFRYKQSKQPEVVLNRFQKTNIPFRKNVLFHM